MTRVEEADLLRVAVFGSHGLEWSRSQHAYSQMFFGHTRQQLIGEVGGRTRYRSVPGAGTQNMDFLGRFGLVLKL